MRWEINDYINHIIDNIYYVYFMMYYERFQDYNIILI